MGMDEHEGEGVGMAAEQAPPFTPEHLDHLIPAYCNAPRSQGMGTLDPSATMVTAATQPRVQ